MGHKYVTPNPGQKYDDIPFRNSAMGSAEPKTIYKEGDKGQKFVVPNPSINPEEGLVRNPWIHFY